MMKLLCDGFPFKASRLGFRVRGVFSYEGL